jgi:YesN/AraC family two-component response regulator
MSCISKLYITLTLFVAIHSSTRSKALDTDLFQSNYYKASQLIRQTADSLETLVELMKLSDNKTDIQRAKLNLICSKMHLLDEMQAVSRLHEEVLPDTADIVNPLLKSAQAFIIQSRPDEGIPLILEYLESVDHDGDSAIYGKIFLAEAYRQKQEYSKGIEMIYEVLGNKKISPSNRAFALSRMAALMNEKRFFDGNRVDSVFKYSRLCIQIAQEHDLTEYLALSQNELGNNYLSLNRPDSALFLITEAARNFLSIHKIPQTINTYLNLSRIYASSGQLEQSKEILVKALELGNMEENRNLFKYVYYYLADRCFRMGDLNSAYEYLNISYSLMSQFFNDRIQMQINEISARFDLNEKETRIKEEIQKNRTYRLRVKYISLISIISISLLVVLVILFRFKNQAYKKLVEHTLKSLKLEKQVELCLRNLSENDIRQKINAEDRNAELSLRLEKYLAEEKPYLWCDVTLEEFCKKLNTNRTYISRLINDEYNMSFYDLLFEYRVRAALEYLNNPQYDHLSIEGIGELSGFKSNSNFYKRFKNMVGMTPSLFRERARKIKI